MKSLLPKLVLFFLFCTFYFQGTAQVGIGTDAPNAKAVLELKSPGNNQGFLVPRLTTSERGAMALTSLEKGMLVFDTSVDKFYYWSGTAWQIIEDTSGTGTVTSINTGTGLTGGPISVAGTISIAPSGVTTIELANNSVTTAKIADGTIATGDLADGAITDVKVTTVAPSKLTAGGATTGQVLKWNGTNWAPQADASGSGTVTNIATGTGLTGGPITATGTISLADGGVTTVKLADAGVTTVKIADNNITTAKILDGTIATADLADGSVTDVKVTAVAPGKITQAGATTGQVLKWNGTNWAPQADASGSGTVTNIATGTGLTGGPITATGTISLADGGVTTVKLADAGVTTVKIADNSITTAKILDGTIATADLANESVTAAKLANTTVTPGTYGTSTQVSQLTVDAQGRITGASNVTITGAAPTGAAGGDLTGTFPNPAVAGSAISTAKLADGAVTDIKIAGVAPSKLTAGGATTGQVLKWNGTNWTPQADASGSGTVTNIATGAGLTGGPITATGTISLADGGVTTVKLADAGVTTVKIADNNITTAKILDGTIATGDLADGAITDVKVTAVAPGKITQAGATTGQVLKWSGSSWTPQADASGSGTVTNIATGTGLTGGPITATGTISLADGGVTTVKLADAGVTTVKIADNNITTAKILDGTIATGDIADGAITDVKVTTVAPSKLTAGGATTGQVLKWSGTNWTAQADATGTDAQTLAFTSPNLSISGGNSVNLSTLNTDAQNLTYTPASGLLAISGGNNVTITGTVPGGTAGGDLTGTYPNPTVDGLQGRAVTNTAPTTGQVLKWNGSAWAPAADATGAGISGSGASDQITFWSGSSSVTGTSDFVWDSKNNFLGVNIATPKGNLHVNGSQYASVTVLPAATSNYEIKPNDFIIVAPSASNAKPMNVGLPLSTDNLGRIITIRTMGPDASTGARVVLVDSKDKLDDGQGSYFLIFNKDATSYVYSVTVVATPLGWVTIGRERNANTN